MNPFAHLVSMWRGVTRRPTADPSYVAYLQETARSAAIQALRAQSLAQLQLERGDYVIDLGCGPGTVTTRLALMVGESGRVTGVDTDPAMVAAANALALSSQVATRVSHHVGTCTSLSFAAGLFDACYCERVFQHLSGDGPQRATAEAMRILKPGGRFVVVDTDWSSLQLYDDKSGLGGRVKEAWVKQFPNPRAGQLLRGLMLAAGALDLHESTSILELPARGATATSITARAAKTLSARDLTIWRTSLDVALRSRVPVGQVAMTIVAGTKP